MSEDDWFEQAREELADTDAESEGEDDPDPDEYVETSTGTGTDIDSPSGSQISAATRPTDGEPDHAAATETGSPGETQLESGSNGDTGTEASSSNVSVTGSSEPGSAGRNSDTRDVSRDPAGQEGDSRSESGVSRGTDSGQVYDEAQDGTDRIHESDARAGLDPASREEPDTSEETTETRGESAGANARVAGQNTERRGRKPTTDRTDQFGTAAVDGVETSQNTPVTADESSLGSETGIQAETEIETGTETETQTDTDTKVSEESDWVALGIGGLDTMVHDGVPPSSVLTTMGAAGTGKTTFAIEFLDHTLASGNCGVYITLEESREAILTAAERLGRSFREYERAGHLVIVSIDPAEMANSLASIRNELTELIGASDVERVVLDSVSLLEMMYDSPAERRSEVLGFTQSLKEAGVTTLLTSETSAENRYASRHGLVEHHSDAVFVQRYVRSSGFQETQLAIEIQKIRGADHSRETNPYEITDEGLSVRQQADTS